MILRHLALLAPLFTLCASSPYFQRIAVLADIHGNLLALEAVSHWLGSFAVYLVSGRGLR